MIGNIYTKYNGTPDDTKGRGGIVFIPFTEKQRIIIGVKIKKRGHWFRKFRNGSNLKCRCLGEGWGIERARDFGFTAAGLSLNTEMTALLTHPVYFYMFVKGRGREMVAIANLTSMSSRARKGT